MMSAVNTRRRVLLLGGTSEIGLAILRAMAADVSAGPLTPVLLGRDIGALDAAAEKLTGPGYGPVETGVLDADQLSTHEPTLAGVFESGPVDTVILAVGTLGGQQALDTPREQAMALLHTNFSGCASLVDAALRRLRAQRSGTLVVISSVAGVRPRAGLAYYGAAKAGVDALAQALGDAALADGVRTLVIRPGFVRTRMTAGLKPAPLATTPERVAAVTVKALNGDAHTAWAPPALRWLALVLSWLPRSVWRKVGR